MAEDPLRPDFTDELPDEPLPQSEPNQDQSNGSGLAEALKDKAKEKTQEAKGKLTDKAKQQGREAANQRFSGLRERLPFLRSSAAKSGTRDRVGQEAAAKAVEVVEDVKTRARNQAIRRAAKNTQIIAKRAVVNGARWLATTIGPEILVVVGVLILIVGIIFLLYYLLAGPKMNVTTQSDKTAVTTLLAAAGSPNALGEVTVERTDSIINKIRSLETEASKTDPGNASAFKTRGDQLITKLRALKATSGLTERQKLLTEIKEEVKKLQNDFPKILLAASPDCTALATPIANGSLKIKRDPEKKTLPLGQLVRGGHPSTSQSESGPIMASPNVCKVFNYLLNKGYKIGGVTLTYGHRKCSKSVSGSSLDPNCINTSQHFMGEGIDFYEINGQSVLTSAGKALAKDIQADLQQNHKTVGVYQLFGPAPFDLVNCEARDSISAALQKDHNDHIHIGVVTDRHLSNAACRP